MCWTYLWCCLGTIVCVVNPSYWWCSETVVCDEHILFVLLKTIICVMNLSFYLLMLTIIFLMFICKIWWYRNNFLTICYICGIKQDGGNGHEFSEDGGSTSSSEDELLLMARHNLKWTQEFIALMAPIFGMYFDKYFIKLPPWVDGESGMQWVQRTLARDNSCYNMFWVERPLFNRLHNTLIQSYGL